MKTSQEEIKFPSVSVLSEPLSGYFRCQFLLKKWIKKLIFSKSFGPKGVLESILQGLEETSGIQWNYNPSEDKLYEIVYVPIGLDALRYALQLKKSKKIKKLIVGPNITSPTSARDIFFHPEIDTIVVPSPWIRDWFFYMLGRKDRRISLLPAGVDDCGPRTSSEKVIVFKKECPENIFQVVCTALNNQGIDYEVYEYGKFKKQEYLQTLSETKFLIYLQTSETQGIALHEAWMRDVPTLVWNRGYCEYKGNIWKDPHISAPYLTSECGMFFTSEEDFPETFHLFFQKLSLYSPRQYSLDHFTHKQTIAKLLSLL